MTGKRLRKIVQQVLLMFYTLKKWKYVSLICQQLTLIVILNCLHSFRTENKLKSREKVYKNKDLC